MTRTTIYIMEETNQRIHNIDSNREGTWENEDGLEEEQMTVKELATGMGHKPGHSEHKQHNRKAAVRKKRAQNRNQMEGVGHPV